MVKKYLSALICLALAISLTPCVAFAATSDNSQDKPYVTDKDPHDFDGGTFSTVLGSSHEATLKKFYGDNVDLLQFSSASDEVMAVSEGKAVAFMVEPVNFAEILRQYPDMVYCSQALTEEVVTFPFPKTADGEKLLSQFNAFLAEISTDGTFQQLQDYWMTTDLPNKSFLENTELAGENGTLRVVSMVSLPPYQFYSYNQPVGYCMDLLTMFCQKYGYDYVLEDATIDSILLGLSTGAYDMGALNLAPSAERAKSMNFADPIYKSSLVLAYKNPDAVVEQVGLFEGLAASFNKTFIAEDRWVLMLTGLGTTLLVALCSMLLSTLLGFAIAMVRRRFGGAIDKFFAGYVKLFQGLPVLVVLLIFYYVIFGSTNVPAIAVAILVFSLNSAAYVSEVVRTSIAGVDNGQTEAAVALGYTERQAFFKFVLPQALQTALPVYRGEMISLLKGTAIVGYIAIQDLTKAGDIIRSRTFEALFPLLAVAIIYFILSLLLSFAIKRIEKKFALEPDRSKRVIKGVKM